MTVESNFRTILAGLTAHNLSGVDAIKPGFHIIIRIVLIAPIVSKCVQAIGTIIWKCSETINQHFYPAIGTIGNFCKKSNETRFQAIGTIDTNQNCPRKQQFLQDFTVNVFQNCVKWKVFRFQRLKLPFYGRGSKGMSIGYNKFYTIPTRHFSQKFSYPKRFFLSNFISLLFNTLQQNQGLHFGPSPTGPNVWGDRWDLAVSL